MEAEVVQMCVDLFNGGEEACGTVLNQRWLIQLGVSSWYNSSFLVDEFSLLRWQVLAPKVCLWRARHIETGGEMWRESPSLRCTSIPSHWRNAVSYAISYEINLNNHYGLSRVIAVSAHASFEKVGNEILDQSIQCYHGRVILLRKSYLKGCTILWNEDHQSSCAWKEKKCKHQSDEKSYHEKHCYGINWN